MRHTGTYVLAPAARVIVPPAGGKPVFGVPRPEPDHRGNGLLQCNAGCAVPHYLCRGAPCGAPAAL
ncbi:hypothetical protein CBM2629_A150039 [Cupriavidus taiwanensis]|nr:hypothetical protein CBM2629_A150039 [Cupriavidus taiwanensis]